MPPEQNIHDRLWDHLETMGYTYDEARPIINDAIHEWRASTRHSWVKFVLKKKHDFDLSLGNNK